MSKSKYQEQFDTLPEWAQKMVRSVSGIASYGSSAVKLGLDPQKWFEFNVTLRRERSDDWWDGWRDMLELAEALTAPWPPPEPPPRVRRSLNAVEMMDDGEEGGGFDQPCCFGNRVGGHAVYCHNDAWPDHPRKCRRSWYTGGEVRDEDCPGYVPNPDYKRTD